MSNCCMTAQGISEDRFLNSNQVCRETGLTPYLLLKEAALGRVRTLTSPYGPALFHLGEARVSARLRGKAK